MIKKADIVLFFIILIAGLIISWVSLTGDASGDKVLISVSGETYGVYDLNRDETVKIEQNGHTNNITIKGGSVSMTYSDCKNQVCVNTGSITQSKASIVCLPNKIMVEIMSEGGGADAITQ